ncbi:MAG: EamA family transporter, partial [Bacteroidia bacterium]
LFTKAETGISSALAGMLNALTPVFAIIVGTLLFKNKTTLHQLTGVVVGFGGAILLVTYDSNSEHSDNNVWYALMVAAATLCYAISVNSIKKFLN